jgi:RimJ/RimL family protein N-acetyltransferase
MVRLLLLDAELSRAVADPDEFERRTGATLGDNAAIAQDVVAQGEAHRARTGAPEEWGGFLALTTGAPSRVVGTCAFVSAPNADGEVEIAYFTFPDHERQGYGLAMAAALIEIAFADLSVTHVLGHTLPERNASTRILSRLGFEFAGPVSDPEDGTVWK